MFVRGDGCVLDPPAADRFGGIALVSTRGRFGVIGASRRSGGPAVWLDTVLAEQLAKAFEFAE